VLHDLPVHNDLPTGHLPTVDGLLSVAAVPMSDRRTAIVKVVGQVDHYTAPLLAACLSTQINRRGLRELVVDMNGVTFLGSAGLSVLVRAQRQCRSAAGARLVVRSGGKRAVLRPLELAGLSWLAQPRGRLTPGPRPQLMVDSDHHRRSLP
jgi:anti-anti-sigma factor